jgi:hypothetical protein
MTKPYVPTKGRVLTPYICCREAAKAIEWYGEVFGATLTGEPYVEADGRIGHAEIEIDGGEVMLSDAYPSFCVDAPPADQLPTYTLVLYVADTDETSLLPSEQALWFSAWWRTCSTDLGAARSSTPSGSDGCSAPPPRRDGGRPHSASDDFAGS